MKPCAYYNEFDPYAAQWLRNLIAAGHIAPGEVDERSITEVQPDDLRGFTQCHFFAGIGGWSYALRLAGVPDDAAVWTGSCPCQPFSAAGKQRGSDDERHLWPAFFDLIRQCRPGTVFGEQVAGAAGYAWWDHVAADLEGEGYAAAAADIGAHSVGAPHLRQRLYWLAHGPEVGRGQERPHGRGIGARDGAQGRAAGLDAGGIALAVAHAGRERLQQRRGHDLAAAPRGDEGQARERQRVRADAGAGFDAGDLGHTDPLRSPGSSLAGSGEGMGQPWAQPARAGADGGLGDTMRDGLRGRWRAAADQPDESGDGPLHPWAVLAWLQCSDGKARPTQPGLFPLVDGVRDGRLAVGSALGQSAASLSEAQAQHRFNRVGVLRGAGNAIVPQVAAAFVRAAA